MCVRYHPISFVSLSCKLFIQSFQDFRFDRESHLVDSIGNDTPTAAISYEVKHNIS